MMLLLKISIILLVMVPLGLMYHVDMNYCVQDFYPPGLYFAVCSETFGFRTIAHEVSNVIYYMTPSRDESMIIPLCDDVTWLSNGKCLEPKPGSDQTITLDQNNKNMIQKFTKVKTVINESGLKTHTVYTDFNKQELVIGISDEHLVDGIADVLDNTPYRLEIVEHESLIPQRNPKHTEETIDD